MSELDPLILARMQFAFTVSFHIMFPTISIGLALFLAIVEGLWLKTGDLVYRQIYRFWLNIFAMGFASGVVTGIVMAFEFGLTFSCFSQIAGPVIGPLIALEVLTSFFLEAGFLGIMLFGEGRVGPRLHFFATCMVALRGVSFEFRHNSGTSRRRWDVVFAAGSLVAGLAQGIIVGGLIQGVTVDRNAFAGSPLDTFSPFCILTGVTVV